MPRPVYFVLLANLLVAFARGENAATTSIDQLIPWLLRENGELREIPFSKVILDATGKRVLAIDPKSEADQRVIGCIRDVLDEVMKRTNAADSPVQNLARI